MDQLKTGVLAGTIAGLRINPTRSLVHQLFADDTGFFLQMDQQVFLQTTDVLTKFEEASGAKLNMNKSTAIPLSTDQPPEWLRRSGCQVASPQDRFRYLGILAEIDVLDEEITGDVQRRYTARINHWANHMLSWPAKVILCRNVLGALPYYTLMTVGLSKLGMTQLQRTTRDFLWISNDMGRKKKPLIAWSTFERKKKHGGLGWPPLSAMADAFLLRNIIKIIQGVDEDWIKLAEEIIKDAVRAGNYPANTSVRFLTELLHRTDTITRQEMQELQREMRKEKITNACHITDPGNGTPTLKECLLNKTDYLAHTLLVAVEKFDAAFPVEQATDITWEKAEGWGWENSPFSGAAAWKLKTRHSRDLLYTHKNDETKLSYRWGINHDPTEWGTRWSKLWKGDQDST
ncbi:hypothetical protein R1sor_008590 [Riccia sorocarpa]|uniref:Reverse transcriptase domain-containing protein n=1 Tax=Riccia sorocarpa TaxID=122646 RepID=A0ABD3I038_9MARC